MGWFALLFAGLSSVALANPLSRLRRVTGLALLTIAMYFGFAELMIALTWNATSAILAQ